MALVARRRLRMVVNFMVAVVVVLVSMAWGKVIDVLVVFGT